MNFSADHLDRHGSLEAYGSAKARIFGERPDRRDPLQNFLRGNDAIPRRFAHVTDGHQLDEAHVPWVIQREAREGFDLIVVDSAHDDDVDLDRPQAGGGGISNVTLAAIPDVAAGTAGEDPNEVALWLEGVRKRDQALAKVNEARKRLKQAIKAAAKNPDPIAQRRLAHAGAAFTRSGWIQTCRKWTSSDPDALNSLWVTPWPALIHCSVPGASSPPPPASSRWASAPSST